jgi:hypothetical protein
MRDHERHQEPVEHIDDAHEALAWMASALRFEAMLAELRGTDDQVGGWHHVPRGTTAAA